MSEYNLESVRLSFIREKRNRLLLESDIYMVSDYPITDEKREEWKVYRQQLRDMPLNAENVYNENGAIVDFNWPTPPDQI